MRERIVALQDEFDSDALMLMAGMADGIDDWVRDSIEDLSKSGKKHLVVVLETTGGLIEVVNRIVQTLRKHYEVVDFIIPNFAYSAGTVLALSGNDVWMDYYSVLGPIDPQIEAGPGWLPALGYCEKYKEFVEESKTRNLTQAEMAFFINKFDPAELYLYEQSRDLSISLLQDWLVAYKFKNWSTTETQKTPVTDTMKRDRATEIATMLSDTKLWKGHGFGISMEVLKRVLKLRISDFGEEQAKRDLIRNYYRLLRDYLLRLGSIGVVHTKTRFRPLG